VICGLAFCPTPPLLLPEVAGGAAAELDGLRRACDDAIADVLAGEPDLVVVLGAGPSAGTVPAAATGTLAPYGLDLAVALTPGTDGPVGLPLSLTVGAWLLARSGWTGPREGQVVDQDPMSGPGTRAATARALRERPERAALLVMADGSNSRTDKAPGGRHEAAAGFDARVAAVLREGDPAPGLKISLDDAQAVGSQGWPAWRTAFHAASGSRWRARLRYDDAPYGVGYLVASWT
jgi:hypothetical protein